MILIQLIDCIKGLRQSYDSLYDDISIDIPEIEDDQFSFSFYDEGKVKHHHHLKLLSQIKLSGMKRRRKRITHQIRTFISQTGHLNLRLGLILILMQTFIIMGLNYGYKR